MNFTVEGLILKAIPYRESDTILTVFTKEQGILSLFCRKKQGRATTSPLVQAEFVIKPGKGELYPCSEISVIDTFSKIREKIEYLETAYQILRMLLDSQFPHKSTPQLYEMTIKYLKKIYSSPYPETLSASFSMKLLRHEGLFGLSFQCATCQIPLKELFYIAQGECFCQNHHPIPFIILQREEFEMLLYLASSRDLNQISQTPLLPDLQTKILELFDLLIHP